MNGSRDGFIGLDVTSEACVIRFCAEGCWEEWKMDDAYALSSHCPRLLVQAPSATFSSAYLFISARKPAQGLGNGFSKMALAFSTASASSRVSGDTCSRFLPVP